MTLATNNAQSTGGSHPDIQPGLYAARLVRVVDLGVQNNQWEPGKSANEINVTFELMDEYLLDDNGEPNLEKPRVISTFVKLYARASRGTNYDFLQALDPTGTHDGDWGSLCAGQTPCMVNIVLKKKKNSEQLTNKIASISPVMKGQEFRDVKVDCYTFDLDNPDQDTFEKLPDWMQERVNERVRPGEPVTYPVSEEEASVETEEADEADVPW